ncbi:MAG: hypothetical protein D6678_02310 [Zetaproteobacteria bacterium]|nr:MAG: hypothetical protein D6678_02310 [Zetaproteobacteria bacterium]
MAEGEQDPLLDRVRRLQENIAVIIGVVIALTLSLYFFTYAQLVDRGLGSWLWFQAISASLMVLILFRLPQVALFLARLWLGRKREYRERLRGLRVSDLRS